MSTSWWHELEDRMGIKIADHKAIRYEKILNDPLDQDGLAANTTNGELINMVRWLSKQQRPGLKDYPTVDDIWSKLKWYRKCQAGDRRGYDVDTDEGWFNFLKAKIKDAPDYDRRWSIICSPHLCVPGCKRDTTCKECQDLEQLCWDQGLLPNGWRPKLPPFSEIIEKVAVKIVEQAPEPELEELPF